MNKKEFQKLYNASSIEELCSYFGCSAPTIYRRIDELGIPRKGRGKGKRQRRKLIIDE